MEEDNKNAYSEVIEILKTIEDEKKLEALPIEMLEVLKSKADSDYKPQILKDVPLEEQNLQPETFSILAWIAVKYWDEQIEEDTEKISENIDETQEKSQEDISQEESSPNALVLYDNLKWYQKIKMKIINLFNKIFHKGKNEIKINEEEGSTL